MILVKDNEIKTKLSSPELYDSVGIIFDEFVGRRRQRS